MADRRIRPAREFEVLLTKVVRPLSQNGKGSARKIDLAVSNRRNQAFTRAKNALDAARFRALTLNLASWIVGGDWTRNADDLKEVSGGKVGKRRERLAADLKAVQDSLGDLNDIRVNTHLASELSKRQKAEKRSLPPAAFRVARKLGTAPQ